MGMKPLLPDGGKLGNDLGNLAWQEIKASLQIKRQRLAEKKARKMAAVSKKKVWRKISNQEEESELFTAAKKTADEPVSIKVEAVKSSRQESVQDSKNVVPVSAVQKAFTAAGTSPENLKEAVLWSEILGDPVSRRRRKKRMGIYGDQGYAHRG